MKDSVLLKQLTLALKPVEKYMEDDQVTDIIVQGPFKVIIKVLNGGFQETDCKWESVRDLKVTCELIAEHLCRKFNEKYPILDSRLPGGTRVNIVGPPCYENGAIISIRKFPKQRLEMKDLLKYGTIDKTGAEILRSLVENEKKVIVSGGTGTGKTTLLNIITQYIGDNKNVITIEDTRELTIQSNIWTALETKQKIFQEDLEIDLRALVKTTLRMAPRWIILGEIRGAEAFDLLRAFNTGHAGMATIHADSSVDALYALENCVQQGIDIKIDYVRPIVARAIDCVVNIKRFKDEKIRVINISKVKGVKYTESIPEFILEDIYIYDQEKMIFIQKSEI